MRNRSLLIALVMVATTLLAACGPKATSGNKVDYTLKTGIQGDKLVYIGVGGSIDGVVNPTLQANVGDVVTITLSSGDGAEHNIAFPDFNVDSPHVIGQGRSISVTFSAYQAGSFPYYCSLPGHRQAGMEGKFEVTGNPGAESTTAAASPTGQAGMPTMDMTGMQGPSPASGATATSAGADIVRDPTDLPGPLPARAPTTVRIDLEAQEVVGRLAEGTTFTYWTFNGKVPGPFFRVRVGDTVEVHLKNNATSTMPHSVDFHAVTGPGGGAVYTTTAPGQETSFTFKALHPGIFVYHCATPMVAEHIANGMYGLILVEPDSGLPKADREFYVMQGEIYTAGGFGDPGTQLPDVQKILNETPEYYVLNGAIDSLTTLHPLTAKVGETVRIFYGVGGPNKTAAFHVIGEIFDRVYNLGSLTAPPLVDVQTVVVPPGGATIVEFALQVPGRYILVDHALARMQRGLAGYLVVQGPARDVAGSCCFSLVALPINDGFGTACIMRA
jgi:nitrite reductase (NO-forming)